MPDHVVRAFARSASVLVAVVAVAACGLRLPQGAGPAGSLDPSFGAGGKVLTAILGFDEAAAVVGEPDGRIVAAGVASSNQRDDEFALVRYERDGLLDRSFGTGGIVTTAFAGEARATALARQPDGKVVVVGGVEAFPGGFALARYDRRGRLDPAFGLGGTVVTRFGNAPSQADAVTVLPGGKLLVAGFTQTSTTSGFTLVRYDRDGRVDTTFGTDGVVLTDFGHGFAGPRAMARYPDGRVVVAGMAFNGTGGTDFAVARYRADGTLDPTFRTGGVATVNFTNGAGHDGGQAVALQRDGKVVVAGAVEGAGFGLVRFDVDGTLDPTFGTDGRVETDYGVIGFGWTGVAVQRDGKIVAAGSAWPATVDFALARFEPNGRLDPGFGTGGKVTTDVTGGNDLANAMMLQRDGRIVVAGRAPAAGPGWQFALARYEGGR